MKNIPATPEPNPQGKGLVPIIAELDSRDQLPSANTEFNSEEALKDYIVSRLILCADFGFKPVPDKQYYLYCKGKQLRLSLVSPAEWSDSAFGIYLGSCVLEQDMVWTFTGLRSDEAQNALQDAVEDLKDTLLSDLTGKVSEHRFDYYDERLPFHRRILARALTKSTAYKLGSDGLALSGKQPTLLTLFSTNNTEAAP